MAIELVKIQNGCGKDAEWEPGEFHRVHPDQVGQKKHWWRMIYGGICVLGSDAPFRTRGRPATLRRIQDKYGQEIYDVVETVGEILYDGPSHEFDEAQSMEDFEILIAATIATESGGRLPADRHERRIRDWSFGLLQTLTNTAYAIGKRMKKRGLFHDLPSAPVPNGGDPEHWKAFLDVPANSILLGAFYLKEVNDRFKLKGDPVLVYSSYNAGSPRPSKATKFGTVYYDPDLAGPKPGAVDKFVEWYGDACHVWRE